MNKLILALVLAAGSVSFSPQASAQSGRGGDERGDRGGYGYDRRYDDRRYDDDRRDGYRRDNDGDRYNRGRGNGYRGRGGGAYRGRHYGHQHRARHYGWHGARGFGPRCPACRGANRRGSRW